MSVFDLLSNLDSQKPHYDLTSDGKRMKEAIQLSRDGDTITIDLSELSFDDLRVFIKGLVEVAGWTGAILEKQGSALVELQQCTQRLMQLSDFDQAKETSKFVNQSLRDYSSVYTRRYIVLRVIRSLSEIIMELRSGQISKKR